MFILPFIIVKFLLQWPQYDKERKIKRQREIEEKIGQQTMEIRRVNKLNIIYNLKT